MGSNSSANWTQNLDLSLLPYLLAKTEAFRLSCIHCCVIAISISPIGRVSSALWGGLILFFFLHIFSEKGLSILQAFIQYNDFNSTFLTTFFRIAGWDLTSSSSTHQPPQIVRRTQATIIDFQCLCDNTLLPKSLDNTP